MKYPTFDISCNAGAPQVTLLKAVRDGVADAIGLPDNDKRLSWAYVQATAADYAVRIEIKSKAPTGRKG